MKELNSLPEITCIAVDDEPFALQLIRDDIDRVPFLKLLGTFSSAHEAMAFLEHSPVDLMFLDIQMPEITGITFLRGLSQPPMVIFVTAYEGFALEGFELDVIDYLVKPVPFERFLKAATKARQQLALLRGQSPDPAEQFIFIRAEYKEIKVAFDDIKYVEGLKDYVKIFLASQTRPLLTRMNLKAISSRLPAQRFVRIHNSFIVPLAKITASQKSQVFIGPTAIPVGDKYAAAFRNRYEASK